MDTTYDRTCYVCQIHTGAWMTTFTVEADQCYIFTSKFFIKNLLTCLQEATNSCLLLRILPSPITSRIANFSLRQRLHLSPLPTNNHSLMMISELQCGVWIYLLLLLLLVVCKESDRIFIFGIGQAHLMIVKTSFSTSLLQP